MRKSFLIRPIIVFVVIAVACIFIGSYEFGPTFKKPVDLCGYDITDAKVLKKGTAVDTNIETVFGSFASMESYYEDDAGTKTRRNEYNYYAIPVFVGEEVYVIACRAELGTTQNSKLSDLEYEFWDYIEGYADTYGEDPMALRGGLYELEDEGYDYLMEFMKDLEFYETDAEYEKYVLPLVLREHNATNAYVGLIGGAVAGLIAIIMILFLIFADGKYKARKKELKSLGEWKTVRINGQDMVVSKMEDVDKAVFYGDIPKAVKKVKSYGANQQEAEQIVANWREIASTTSSTNTYM